MNKAQVKKAVEARIKKGNVTMLRQGGDYESGFVTALSAVYAVMDEIEGTAFKNAMDKADKWSGELKL